MDSFSDRALSIAERDDGIYISGVDGFVADANDVHKLIQTLREVEARLCDRKQRLAGLALEQEACRLLYARAPSDDYVTLAPRNYYGIGGAMLVRLHKTAVSGFGAIFESDGNVGTIEMPTPMVNDYRRDWRDSRLIVVGDNR